MRMRVLKTVALAVLAAVAAMAPATAQDRPAGLVGSGVAPSDRANSPERPIRFSATPPTDRPALVIPVTAPLAIARAAPGLSTENAAAIQRAAETVNFVPEANRTLTLHAVGGHPVVVLVGMKPEAASPTPAELADAAGSAIQAMRQVPHAVAIAAGGLPPGSAQHLAFGAALGQYRFDRLQPGAKAPPADPITIVAPDAAAAQMAWQSDWRHVADGVRLARDLVTMPANELYPESFVDMVRSALRGVPDVRVTVLDEAQMRSQGMGSILSVAQGSRRPARILAVEVRGGGGAAPLAMVGKGITFDSGGISIKQNAGMWEMKGDMAGAAGVMGAAVAAAKRGAKANVVAVAALAENMPGGNASRPGDVVRTMTGQTIEIWSTDAEGRLVLADANPWTIRQFRPAAIVNLATLTGSVVGALGPEYTGLFTGDDALAARLTKAARDGGEDVWRLPLHPNYRARMASEIADIRNSSGGPGPGAGLGAHFIDFLTPGPTPWAHIDMAAVDRADPALPTVPKGPRGYGVRLFDQLIRQYETQ